MILQYLNQDQYISREQLVKLSGLCDRTVRKEIENLRLLGIVVCSHSEGLGYKLAATEKEHNQTRRLYESRIESELEVLKACFGNDKVRNFLMKQIIIINEEEKWLI